MTLTPYTMQHPSLASDNIPDVLRLIRTLNVGPVTFFQLIRRFGTAAKAIDALPDLAFRGGRRNPLTVCPQAAANREMESALEFGATMILYGTPEYPKLLHAIADPPPLITVIGNLHLWRTRDSIAVVGARNASAGGCQFAGRIARELGEAGLIVASGLARGIDTFAHKGALPSGTVAVIAGGIDNIYPPENENLYRQIRETGAIISEQPFGLLPFSGSFPGRNRIIAGMSLGTLVVEASPKSGSLITARLAGEYGREVFAVPGSPLDPRSKGCNQLLRDGASMAESAGDVLQGIAALRNRTLGEKPPAAYASARESEPISESDLTGARRLVIEKLSISAVSVDELIEQCETPAGATLTILLELELAGRLKRSPGNKVYLTDVVEEEVA